MMNRVLRRLVARIAIAGVLFAQMAMAAYALPPPGAGAAAVAPGAPVDAARAHCDGMPATPASAPANVCEVHCTDGAVLPVAPDLPPVVLDALPAAPLALGALGCSNDRGQTFLAALAGAPPPSLEFCRLLI